MGAIKAPKKYYLAVAGYLRFLIPREKANKIIENVYEKYKAEMPENMPQVFRCYSETKQYDKYFLKKKCFFLPCTQKKGCRMPPARGSYSSR